jgi:lipopolysaccharide/colanic/teichoic acid biosynthesis glycosyltransferase
MTHPALHSPFPFGVRPARTAPLSADAELTRDLVCRALNVLVAFIGVVITAPLMAVIAILIKATSSGPVIYTQTRVGWDRRSSQRPRTSSKEPELCGMPFTIYKFRTMAVAKPDASQVWAQKNDPRITKVGRILRKFRLDELPQLFNVLIGDMNVVGPRPEQPDIVKRLAGRIGHYAARQQVLPGITGLAQVTMGYDASVDDVRRKVALDLEYVRRRSPLEDLRIMARTTLVMLSAHGT